MVPITVVVTNGEVVELDSDDLVVAVSVDSVVRSCGDFVVPIGLGEVDSSVVVTFSKAVVVSSFPSVEVVSTTTGL